MSFTFIILSLLAIFIILCRDWIKGVMGDIMEHVFPKSSLSLGDKVEIFLNGKHNRTATITRITDSKLYIYGTLDLPIDYRGRFYAVGIDRNDGSKIIYLKKRKHYRYVRMAEIIRSIIDTVDDEDMLPSENKREETAE